jgi:uncharacterized protein involved in exopolysaccharide biosynthesis
MRLIDRLPSWLSDSALTPTKNWRLVVFVAVFAFTAVGGLIINYSRTAQYRAGARLEIVPAEKVPGDTVPAAAPSSGPDSAFLTEVQLLTTRPALEDLAGRAQRAGFGAQLTGPNPVSELQRVITLEPVQGTQVVQLWATGENPEVLPFILNELVAIYQAKLGERFTDDSSEAANQGRDEVAKYKIAILQKRRELEAFRLKYGIVSGEREENEITSRAKGLNTAINAAEEKAVTAQTKLRALRASIAAGKGAVRAKDNPTLADLELRLSQAREELRQLERRYTSAYLAREPQAVALKTKIPELESQIKREREASQQASVAEAEQEAQQTQEAVESLRRQLSGERQSAQSFSARLGEYTALQTQLTDLEKLQGGASERLVKLEAREGARRPKVRIIQSATVPGEPWRPNYHRDAVIVLAGSLILAWLAAWLADFLMRRESGPTVIVAPAPIAYPVGVTELTHREPAPALAPSAPAGQLPAPRQLPRELEEAELVALLEAADDETRVALAALLSGASPEELTALAWSDFDFDANIVKVTRPAARSIMMDANLGRLFAALKQRRNAEAGDALLSAPSLNHLESLISYAAHDAGLQQPAEINPWVIRHAFISYLVRQGIRFSDLARIVGALPAEVTAAYGALLPAGSRRTLEQTDSVLPALRQFAQKLLQESLPNEF